MNPHERMGAPARAPVMRRSPAMRFLARMRQRLRTAARHFADRITYAVDGPLVKEKTPSVGWSGVLPAGITASLDDPDHISTFALYAIVEELEQSLAEITAEVQAAISDLRAEADRQRRRVPSPVRLAENAVP